MTGTYQYDLFLSHNSCDKPWVERLGADLEAQTIGDRKLRVFLDAWDIPYGANIPLRLEEALTKSAFVALVMTPEMLTSEWCRAEWSSQLHRDPTNRLGRILPIRLRDVSVDKTRLIDVPSFLQTLKYFDFRKENDYKRELEQLVAHVRGEPTPRGRGSTLSSPASTRQDAPQLPIARAEPSPDPETLLSNSLIVTSGSDIWTARTLLTRQLPASHSPSPPPTVVRGGFLHSFRNPVEELNPYREFAMASDIRAEPMERWTADLSRRSVLVELLNLEVTRQLAKSAIVFDRSHERFVVERKGEGSRMVRTGSGRPRTILRAPDKDKTGFWVHQAARLSFDFIGSVLVLVVDPALHFTSDGWKHAPREMVPRLQAQWSGRERNRAILGSVLLWIDLLTQGQRRAWIPQPNLGFELRRLPLLARSPRSISGDHVDIKVIREFVATEIGTGNTSGAFSFLENASSSDLDAAEDWTYD